MDNVLQKTDIIVIRPLRISDLQSFLAYRSDPEVTRYQGLDVSNEILTSRFISEQSNKSLDDVGEWVQFGIVRLPDELLVGDCGIKIRNDNSGTAEIGITISRVYRRMGLGKETLRAMIDFLFRYKSIRRIVETVDVENNASINLLKSLHFRLEGHFIESSVIKGKIGSEYQFALLLREWIASNSCVP